MATSASKKSAAGDKSDPKRSNRQQRDIRKETGRLGDAVWAEMRDEYVTGNESYAEIGRRKGVSKKTVEKHALNRKHPTNEGQTWGERRADFRRRVSDQTEDRVSEAASTVLAVVREKSASVAKLALEELERRLTRAEPDAPVLVETKDLVQVAKLAATIKVELSGDPAAPVLVREKLDQLSIEQLKKLAEDGE